jgi:hypothetical protein
VRNGEESMTFYGKNSKITKIGEKYLRYSIGHIGVEHYRLHSKEWAWIRCK